MKFAKDNKLLGDSNAEIAERSAEKSKHEMDRGERPFVAHALLPTLTSTGARASS